MLNYYFILFLTQTDFNDGTVFCEILKGLGGSVPSPEKMNVDQSYWESNQLKIVEAGEKLGVKPVLQPKDMANPEVEHLGIMAYATYLQWVKPRPHLSSMIAVFLESTSGRVGETVRKLKYTFTERTIRIMKFSFFLSTVSLPRRNIDK